MINQSIYRCRPAPAPPHWAIELLAGTLPKEGTPEWDGYISWFFWGNPTPGLPKPQSKEGACLILDARPKSD